MHKRGYQLALGFAVVFAFAHLISLPIAITYDGFQYLDGADVLGTSRFPEDWYRNRTPLYSIALKASFFLFGHHAVPAMLVSTALGLGTILLLGRTARLIAGECCGAVVLVFLSLFPTAVAYQHLILTEIGTSFFIALLITIALMETNTARHAWRQAGFFCLVLAAGYYWRQLVLNLAPVAALLWAVQNWKWVRPTKESRARGWVRLAAAAFVIVVLPVLLSRLWDPFADRAGLAEISMRQGIIRQALLDPSDPIVGANKDSYITAVRESSREGNFFSGVRNDFFDPLLDAIFRSRPMGTGDTRRVFVSGILHHPSRYFAGVTRTALLFLGLKATVNENRIFRQQILSAEWPGAKLGDGPPEVQARIKQQFQQITTSSAVLKLLSLLSPLYDVLVILGNLSALAALAYGMLTRNYKAFALAAFPIAYLALYAIILASIDRFAMPAYPVTLTTLIVLPCLVWRQFKQRNLSFTSPQIDTYPRP